MELIKIESVEGKETVNAKSLHEFMGVKSRFNDWINNRINKYGFVKELDYTVVTKKLVTESNDYYLSIDMAKELSMVENNDKGREARQYFIAREKQAKALMVPDFSNPAEAARAWADQYEKTLLEQKEKENLQIQLDEEKSWYSVKRVKNLWLLPEMKVHNIWRPLRKWSIENNYQIRSIFDANYTTVKTYHADAWKAVYDLDLYFGGTK